MKRLESDVEIALRFKSSVELSFKAPYNAPSARSPAWLELPLLSAPELAQGARELGAARLYYALKIGCGIPKRGPSTGPADPSG